MLLSLSLDGKGEMAVFKCKTLEILDKIVGEQLQSAWYRDMCTHEI